MSVGHVIRQSRETNRNGRFLRKQNRTPQGDYLTSAFDDKKPYILTGLGKQFVHYTMNEIVPKLTTGEEGIGNC